MFISPSSILKGHYIANIFLNAVIRICRKGLPYSPNTLNAANVHPKGKNLDRRPTVCKFESLNNNSRCQFKMKTKHHTTSENKFFKQA